MTHCAGCVELQQRFDEAKNDCLTTLKDWQLLKQENDDLRAEAAADQLRKQVLQESIDGCAQKVLRLSRKNTEQRGALATWMVANGYSFVRGDSVVNILRELQQQHDVLLCKVAKKIPRSRGRSE